jgi:hypothetical protein
LTGARLISNLKLKSERVVMLMILSSIDDLL